VKLPLVVVVNGGTADAAEILAAALQEHKRAKIAGSKTYGRAIVQELFPLQAEDGKHSLLITIARFSTPVEKRILFDTGVKPDVTGMPASFEGWVYDELDDLRASSAMTVYVNNLLEKDEAKSIELAKGDGRDVSRYPGWTDFRKAHENHLTDEMLRWAVRRELRTKLAAAGKLGGGADLEEDGEFVAGLKALGAATGVDLSQVPEYKSMSAAR